MVAAEIRSERSLRASERFCLRGVRAWVRANAALFGVRVANAAEFHRYRYAESEGFSPKRH